MLFTIYFSSPSQTSSLHEQLSVLLHLQLREPIGVGRRGGKHQRTFPQRALGETERQSGGAPGRAAVTHTRHPHWHLHTVGWPLGQGVCCPQGEDPDLTGKTVLRWAQLWGQFRMGVVCSCKYRFLKPKKWLCSPVSQVFHNKVQI